MLNQMKAAEHVPLSEFAEDSGEFESETVIVPNSHNVRMSGASVAVWRVITQIRARYGPQISCIDSGVIRDGLSLSDREFKAALETLERSGRIFVDENKIRLLE